MAIGEPHTMHHAQAAHQDMRHEARLIPREVLILADKEGLDALLETYAAPCDVLVEENKDKNKKPLITSLSR